MFCSNCGKELLKDANYCASCGSPVKPDQFTKMKVENIAFDDYKRIAIERKLRFSYLFLDNDIFDEELLYEIYFNATHSMSSAEIRDKGVMDAFIAGTLVGCEGLSKESIARTNEEIRKQEARKLA